jgi:hypothetical protein
MQSSENFLEQLDNKSLEFSDFIQPNIANQQNLHFTIWRITRLNYLEPENENYQSILQSQFKSDTTIRIASRSLIKMNPDFGKQFILYCLENSVPETRICGISAIEFFQDKSSLTNLEKILVYEASDRVLLKVASLPQEYLTKNILISLIKKSSISNKLIITVFNSHFFLELIPEIQQLNMHGGEINSLDLTLISKLNPIPYDFILQVFENSKEMIHENVSQCFRVFDYQILLARFILPRLNENCQWRKKYNSLKIFQVLFEGGCRWLTEQNLKDSSEFLSEMFFDRIYYVRKTVFEILLLIS